MEHQFVPQISLYRLQNAVFELRIHLYLPHNAYLAAVDVELTRHGDCLLVSGNIPPYAGGDSYRYGHEHVHWDKVVSQGIAVWTDQPCGRFGRSVPIGLSPGTEYVILDCRVECGDYVVWYALRNTLGFVGNACTSIGGDVSQNQPRAHAGFDLPAPVSSQAEIHANANHHPNPLFHSCQPFVPHPSQPTSTQALDISYLPGTNVGGVNAGFGLNADASANVGFSAGTGVNVQLGDASAQPNFNVSGNASGTADLATVQTGQVAREVTQPAFQRTTQTAAGLDTATGNRSGEGTLAGSSGQYNAGFVSGQTQGEAPEVTTLAGSEDVQLGGVVTSQVASGSTQGVGQVQQTTQVAGEQATRVTTGQITQETAQSSTQAPVLTETAQSLTQQITQTATELSAGFADTSGLVNVTESSRQHAGGDVTVGLDTGTGSTLDISAGASTTVNLNTSASANVGLLSPTVSSGQTAQETTNQVPQRSTEALTQQSAQTTEINGTTMNTGSRQVAWDSTRGVGQSSSVEQTTQPSIELGVEARNKGGLVTVAGSSAHYGGQVPDQTQSSVQQTMQSSTQQTMRTSAELGVRKGSSDTSVTAAGSLGQDSGVSVQTQGKEVVGVTITNKGKEVQHELESTQGVDQLLSTQQTMPFFSRQGSQASTDSTLSSDTTLSSDSMLSSETTLSSTQHTKEISTELGVRAGNTSGSVTAAGSSEQYNGGASVQTQDETVSIATVPGGEDVQGGSVTGQVSTQGVIQSSSSVQQPIQSSSDETRVDLEQSFDSDIRKQSQKKAKEEAAGDDKNMKEDVKEENPVPEITRGHSKETVEYARRSESDQKTV